jgi:hypothetical protein
MLGSRTWGYAVVVGLSAAACGGGQGTGGTGAGGSGGNVGAGSGTGAGKTCPVFLPDSPWNTDISAAPVTALYKLPSAKLHPDFDNSPEDGIPYQYVDASTPRSKVTFDEHAASESDPGPYPIPANPLIEGGGAGSGDAHLLMIDTDACVLYELYAASNAGGQWSAYSGATWDLKVDAKRPACWTSADAAGLPIYPGLVRYEEVAAGAINHAIRFTLDTVQTAFVAPANHLTGDDTNPSDPPYGLRVRLKASVDLSAAPPQAKIILTAMKKYGLILADAGSNWYLGGTSDPKWDFDNDVSYIEQFAGSDFEVVDPGALTTPTSTPGCMP